MVVPVPIRKVLGFWPGEMLVARVEDDHLVIEKPESVERRIASLPPRPVSRTGCRCSDRPPVFPMCLW